MKLFFCLTNSKNEHFWTSTRVVADGRSEDSNKAKKVSQLFKMRPICFNGEYAVAKKLSRLFKVPTCFTSNFSCVSSGSKIFLLGGDHKETDEHTNNAYMIDTSVSDYQWEELPSMKVKRCYPASAVVDGKVYVMGTLWTTKGCNPWGEFLDTNKTTGDWDWEPMPSPLKMLQDDYPVEDQGAEEEGGTPYSYELDKQLHQPHVYAVMDEGGQKKIFLDFECDHTVQCLSFNVIANRWALDNIPFCHCKWIESFRGKNVIVDGALFMFWEGHLMSYDLRCNSQLPEEPIELNSPCDGLGYGYPGFLFHLGKGDICLVLQGGTHSEDDCNILCQYFHVSREGGVDGNLNIQFGLLEKFVAKGLLHDCVLVEDF